jgi:hypothetical protein
MTELRQTSKFAIAVRFGLITGMLYAALLFLRYRFFASNPMQFGVSALISYVLILLMYLFTGIARKKELGGYGETREIFQSIFIVILITELVYVLFNFIYLKFIDPAFWENLKAESLSYYQSLNIGYGFSVVIDSLFGLIFASILRKKRPASPDILDQPKS